MRAYALSSGEHPTDLARGFASDSAGSGAGRRREGHGRRRGGWSGVEQVIGDDNEARSLGPLAEAWVPTEAAACAVLTTRATPEENNQRWCGSLLTVRFTM